MLLKHGLISMVIAIIATTTCNSQNTTAKDSLKLKAYDVLVTRCNFCHAVKKKQDIFTIDAMDSLAGAIYEQVFVKKKMPKGRKNKLTTRELELLKAWLSAKN